MSQDIDEKKCEFCEKVRHAFNSFMDSIAHKQPKSFLKKDNGDIQDEVLKGKMNGLS